MQSEFWLERWQQNQIGFHSADINPYLQRFLPDLQLSESSRIFVPLCGKSNDMLWLLAQSHEIVGVELSPIAVNAFFNDNNLTPTIENQDGFIIHHADKLHIYCGDFFQLSRHDLLGVTAVFDRAALVALPPPMRIAYVEKLKQLLSPGCKLLLVIFDYQQTEMEGPPFSLQATEIESLYANWCNLKLLCTEDILHKEPHFRDRGLTHLQEQVYLLTVKN